MPVLPGNKAEEMSQEDKQHLAALRSSCVVTPELKDIAQRVKNALTLYYDSFDEAQGKYLRDKDICFVVAFKDSQIGFIWYPFMLSAHWTNDLESWIEAILTDKEKDFFG